MKFIKQYYGAMIGVVCLCLFGVYLVSDAGMRIYTKSFMYRNTYVNVKLYTSEVFQINSILKKIESIYQKYEEISDRMEWYNDVNNVYYISNNIEKKDEIEIDSILYKILSVGKKYGIESNGYYSLVMGDVIDIWEQAKKENNSIDFTKLENIDTTSENIILLGKNKMKNNHVQLDIDHLAIAFANQEVKEYLESKKISSYLINANGQIIAGKKYNTDPYKVALENKDHDIYHIASLENKSLVTVGDSIRSFSYNNQAYADFYSPITKQMSTFYQNITVIGEDPILTSMIAHTLYHMNEEECKEYIKKYPNIKVIWQNKETVKIL